MRATLLLAALTLAVSVWPCPASDPNAVLWQAPERVTLSCWIWGPGGEARAPRPPFQFIEEDFNGTNPKIKVRDAKGDHWIVKFGGENHGDVFASRMLYAVGYVTEPNYLVASGVVTGAHDLRRARQFIAKTGTFTYARFKLRDHKTLAHAAGRAWSWDDNPFVGTHELSGLKILMMLTSNWDAKDARDGAGSNTAVYTRPESGINRLYYAFEDWGSTMGKSGGFFERDKWNPAGYREQTPNFAGGTPEAIQWGYRGKHGNDITSGISADDVRWLLTYLAPITDEELRAGLRASGATPSQIDIYARCIRERITQLERLSVTPAVTSAAHPAATARR
jgi:hypothetical protein